MADRAVDDDSPEGIVDLVNDDRWQARLEEARARREIALREKGIDPSAAPKRKPMPWELEANKDPKIDPIVQEPDTDRVDFADRVDKVREKVNPDTPSSAAPDTAAPSPRTVAPVPMSRSKPAPVHSSATSSYDDLLADAAFDVPEGYDDEDWAPPPRKRPSAIHAGAPDVIELASRYASTLTPGANAGSVDVFEEAAPEQKPAAAPAVARNHPPALLIVGVILLAAMPLAQTVPPLERGPVMPQEPSLRLQPALGFTTAMLWRPAETSSSDWRPPTNWSLPLGTVFSPQPPSIQTQSNALTGVDQGVATPEFDTPVTAGSAPRSIQPPTLDGASIDRLPGAFSRRPASRPLGGEPIANTRAPSRPPDVASGNEVSPRIAPVTDPDASLLDQATALTTVIFDRAPQIIEQARSALRVPGRSLELTILVPTRAEDQVATGFAEDATRRGHSIGAIKDVNISISTRNVRYFHEADRAEAAQLAKAYNAELRSFTWFTPKPEAGSVELWLEGRAVAPPPAPVVRRAPVVEASPPEPTVVVEPEVEGFLSRLLGGHVVGGFDSRSDGSSGNAASTLSSNGSPSSSDAGTDSTGGASSNTGGSGPDTTGGNSSPGGGNVGNSSGSNFGGGGSSGSAGSATTEP